MAIRQLLQQVREGASPLSEQITIVIWRISISPITK